MEIKDSSTGEALYAYHLLTVLEDRAESAMPPLPAPAPAPVPPSVDEECN
jgi:hypothetical protein